MKTLLIALMLSPALAGSTLWAAPGQAVSLAGKWRFQIDRADAGLAEGWAARALPGSIRLPGDLTEQGVGDPVTPETKWLGGIIDTSWFTAPEYAEYRKPGNVKIPFWLQPELYYAGPAWFQRDIEVPAGWQDRHMVLLLERAHWETRVWIDGNLIGTNTALATPHEYDLGPLAPGKHVLTIRVDNRMIIDVGENSHSVSDHTQGNWNGIVGKIELRARPAVRLTDLRVIPDAAKKTFRVTGTVAANAGGRSEINFEVKSRKGSNQPLMHGRVPVTWTSEGGTFEWAPSPADARLLQTWDEFAPNVYDLTATLQGSGDSITAPLAIRSIATEGTRFTVNGRTTFFRGTLECAIFPKTGHPPTDVASWKKVLQAARAHGLNMLRFHSWCPPEAAFIAADEMGFYYQVEASSWANQTTTLGDGKPVDRWIYEETDRILKYYGNHPSFVLMLYGNEPGGPRHKQYLAKWLEHYRARDPRRLYSSGAGWPQIPENEFHVTPDPRVQAWGEGLKSRINAKPPETVTDYRAYIKERSVPVISHEIGQWCVYPNFDEIRKYTGYLKPRNFEIFRDRLNANGMGKLADEFLHASGKLQALCYKEDIESALRTPGMAGFQLLDLHDFPGQGTALVGVLDPFWEEKGYISPKEYSRFCNPTVPLARLEKRVFTTAETLKATVELSHFGPQPLSDAVLEWRLVGKGRSPVARGEMRAPTIPIGGPTALGELAIRLSSIQAPTQCKLILKLRGTDCENDWDVWVYPENAGASNPEVLVTATLDEAAKTRLRTGGKVLLTIPGRKVRNFEQDPVKPGFSSIFWNTAWTKRQAPTTLGLLCDPRHPALAQFPTESHSNWQWWYLVHRAGALRLDLLPTGTPPIVRVIDDWVTARPLGLVVEGKVDSGRIVICGFDLTRESDDPVSRQLLTSLTAYMGTREFKPKAAFTAEQVESLFAGAGAGLAGVRSVKASSEMGEYDAANIADGDPGTIWHTPWGDGAPTFPHEVVVEFEDPRAMTGVTLLPRQDGNPNGWIKGYEVYVSANGKSWGRAVAQGEFPRDAALKTARFPAPANARFLKLRALSGHANGPWASLAELNVLPVETK